MAFDCAAILFIRNEAMQALNNYNTELKSIFTGQE